MKVKSQRRPAAGRSFWAATKAWLGSRYGWLQLFVVFVVGALLATVVAIEYGPGGVRLLQRSLASLNREATTTIKEATVTNDLPTLYLDIPFQSFQVLRAKRDEAWQKGILINSDTDWQRAKVRFQGKTFPVNIRLKGDWSDHLRDKKWSFRLKTRKGTKLLGMRVFSVQAPYTRNYVKQWLYFQDLRQAGLMTPRYRFLNLVVNGEKWGLYALEEGFSKELVESQGRREGVIVRFDESLSWLYRAGFGDSLRNLSPSSVDSIGSTFWKETFAPVDEFGTTKVQQDPVLRAESETALGMLRGFERGELSVGQVFDPVQFGRYMAHNNLWSERHGLLWHNERYYYNPLTSKLEPIAYDSLPLAEFYGPFTDLSRYDDLPVMKAYVEEVNRITAPDYLPRFQAKYGPAYDHYRQVLSEEFPLKDMQPPWNMLAERQRLLKTALHPPQTVHAYQQVVIPGTTVDLRVANIIRYPVVLEQLKVGEATVAVRNQWVQGDDRKLLYPGTGMMAILRSAPETEPRYLTLHVPAESVKAMLPAGTSLFSNTVQLITRLYAVGDDVPVAVRAYYPPLLAKRATPPQPSVAEALTRYPFLIRSQEPGFLELKGGNWQVDGDLVLPDGMGLLARQPVTLTFDAQAILYANAPLRLLGPGRDSIYLGPKGDHWAGVMVTQTGDKVSLLEHVVISGTAGINRAGWITTGGTTFYESPVVLRGCRLLHSTAGDDINVVRTHFDFRDTEFGYAASDAVDGDFVQGSISNCAFHDLRGDGIDMSGSHVQVDGATFQHIYDKGISSGEQSVITATRISANDLAMAVASKDWSHVRVDDVTIQNAWVAGLAAYQKKAEYGPATMTATNVHFLDSSPHTLVQNGSMVEIDNIKAPTVALNIKTFYRRVAAIGAMRPLNIRFGPAIHLEGMTLFTPKVRPGYNLELSLYWRAAAQPEHDYTVFIHVLDATGKQIAQQDVMPANNGSHTSGWHAGQFVDDFHAISIPPDTLPGEYWIQVGLYNWKTGVRLPAYTVAGVEFKDDIVPLPPTFQVR